MKLWEVFKNAILSLSTIAIITGCTWDKTKEVLDANPVETTDTNNENNNQPDRIVVLEDDEKWVISEKKLYIWTDHIKVVFKFLSLKAFVKERCHFF